MSEPKHTINDLYQMQSLPLSAKIQMTRQRIRGWIDEYGEDGVYVSFSGGKDSTVLLDIVRKDYPGVIAVFSDTGLEYPEIREFVKGFENVEWIKPKLTFRQVIEKYGYPFISKEVSETVDYARKYVKSLDKANAANTIPERERERERERESTVLRSDGGFVGHRQTGGQKERRVHNAEKGDYP